MVIHPGVNMMASASADNIKQWKFPDGNFIQNLTGPLLNKGFRSFSRQNLQFRGGL